MTGLVVIFVVCGIIWAPAILLFAIGGVDKKHKIVGSLICLAFWVFMALGLWGQAVGNAERWNNGYCECGQHWELNAVDKSRNGSETKYYSCPECFTEIKIIE